MSEPITEMDIKNWREYYSEIPEYEMLGRDLFAISCMDTIDALRAELGMKNDALESYAEFYDKATAACGLVDALPGSATDEIILTRLLAHDGLRAELDRERDEHDRCQELYADAETRADAAEAEARDLRIEVARLREIIRNTFDTLAENISGVKL